MPLANAINKTSDTFFATSNITANFTSPVLTTVANSITFSNRFAAVLQSTNESVLTSEYYNNDTTTASGTNLVFTRALGTRASPANVSTTLVPITTIQFAARVGGANANSGYIRAYANNTSSTLNIFTSVSGFVLNGYQSFASADSLSIGQVSENATVNSFYFNIQGSSSGDSGLWVNRVSNNQHQRMITCTHFTSEINSSARIDLIRSRGTGPTNFSTIVADDLLGQINFGGQVNTFSVANRISASITGQNDNTTPNSSNCPGKIIIRTVPIGSNVLTESMQIDSAGRITQIRQPSFSASLSADVASATGDGTAYVVAFNTEQYDQGSNFAANTFTAPIAGKYRFAYTISVDDLLVGHTKLELTVGGRVVERCNPYAIADSDGFCLLSGMVDLSLAALATVTMVVTVSGSTKTVTVKGTTSSGTFLSGQLQV